MKDHREQRRRKADTEVGPLVKRLRPSADRRAHVHYIEAGTGSLDGLPPKMLRYVLSFIGPTSNSVVSLSEVNKKLHASLGSIATRMLPQAQACFRVRIRPYNRESTTSLFVRHARTFSRVLEDLGHLNSILDQDPDELDTQEVLAALNMAVELIETGPALSRSLERQILSTCGKCGGKAFKYSKWILTNRLSRPVDANTPEAVKLWSSRVSENQTRLDLARSLMQMVVAREFQLSGDDSSPFCAFMKRSSDKHLGIMGCY